MGYLQLILSRRLKGTPGNGRPGNVQIGVEGNDIGEEVAANAEEGILDWNSKVTAVVLQYEVILWLQ